MGFIVYTADMKKIYFVRHGESEGNIGPVRQSPETNLTSTGLKQAHILAERLSHINFDILVSSPFVRTYETAKIISEKTHREIILNDLIIERKRPSEQIGQLKSSESNIQSELEYAKAFVENKKYKDGESFEEIRDRAKQALEFLDGQDYDSAVVVTHGIFLKVICGFVLLGEQLNAENCFKLIKNLKAHNTGITVIQKDSNNNWRVMVINDYAHFAE